VTRQSLGPFTTSHMAAGEFTDKRRDAKPRTEKTLTADDADDADPV